MRLFLQSEIVVYPLEYYQVICRLLRKSMADAFPNPVAQMTILSFLEKIEGTVLEILRHALIDVELL